MRNLNYVVGHQTYKPKAGKRLIIGVVYLSFGILWLFVVSACNVDDQLNPIMKTILEGQKPTPVIPLPQPTPVEILPPDLEQSFNPEICPRYCWHGIMLGQTEEEALAAIRRDPVTRKDINFQEGDYIRIQQLSDNLSSIDWFVQSVPHSMGLNGIFLTDGIVSSIFIHLGESFPLQAILDKFGPPNLLLLAEFYPESDIPIVPEEIIFDLIYPPEMGLRFTVRAIGSPVALTRESQVEAIGFLDLHMALESYCAVGFMRWDGLGDFTKYIPSQGNDLEIKTLDDCSIP